MAARGSGHIGAMGLPGDLSSPHTRKAAPCFSAASLMLEARDSHGRPYIPFCRLSEGVKMEPFGKTGGWCRLRRAADSSLPETKLNTNAPATPIGIPFRSWRRE